MAGGWVLDVLLLVILVAQAAAGWRQGFLVGVASLVGFVIGIVGGSLLLTRVVAQDQGGPNRLLLVLAGGLVAGVVLQAAAVAVAYRVRRGFDSDSAKAVDTVVGAIAALVASSAVIWVLAWGLRTAPLPLFGRLAEDSQIVAALDDAAPPAAERAADRFFARVSGEWFPRVFQTGNEEIRDVPVPDTGVVAGGGVQAAAASVVKIVGLAEACDRPQEGSGFVVGPGRVVTNAHVVAGMPSPTVQVAGSGRFLAASVVAFDAARDLAVLAVDELDAPSLVIGVDADEGADVVIAGFPEDGPYDVQPGRVRDVLQAVGDDIYGNSGTQREVYSLFATVRPGNSGGPLLSAQGELVGVVFARSVTDATTGYALTLGELAPVLDAAEVAVGAVDVGACAVG